MAVSALLLSHTRGLDNSFRRNSPSSALQRHITQEAKVAFELIILQPRPPRCRSTYRYYGINYGNLI